MSREITTHKVNGCNEALRVEAVDEPGSGGANHHYEINGHIRNGVNERTHIRFQDGPIKEVGTNGLTHEALTAVIIDRLEAFQRGPFACAENQEALDLYRAAMTALKSRTEKRLARGVEGTHTV